jgi:hypothetical protein
LFEQDSVKQTMRCLDRLTRGIGEVLPSGIRET